MSSVKQKKGGKVLFYKDAVSDVLPYLAVIDKNSLSVSDKNSVYGKVAGSVVMKNMSEAVAMLVKFSNPGFELAADVLDRLYEAVETMYVEQAITNSTKEFLKSNPDTLSRVCANSIRNTVGIGRTTLRDSYGKVLCEITESDMALLLKTYPKLRVLYARGSK